MRRFRSLVAFLLFACLLPAAFSPARAEEGLYLTWGDCFLGSGATQDLQSDCANENVQELYCAFRMPVSADSVLGMELVVDIQHSALTLPPWWHFEVGGCRAGCLVPGFDFTSMAGCVDFYGGDASGDLQGYYVTEPRGGANQARIKVAASVLPSVGGYATLDAESMYYAARLTIYGWHSVEPDIVCSGCSLPACLVLNSILIRRQPGAVGGDLLLSVGGAGNANFATWQSGVGADCWAVPARAPTWGQIKALYR